MNEKLLYGYCWLRSRVRDALWPAEETWVERQEGLSRLAIEVILVAVGVALVIAVAAILGPRIIDLANRTGSQIENVPLDWGQ